MDFDHVARRKYLTAVAATASAGLAGCNDSSSNPSSPTPSETVVFTDSPTDTASPDTQPTETTTPTEASDDVVFDGGDAESFQNALDTVADTPGSTLYIEEGTYQLDPSDRKLGSSKEAHFEALDLQDVTIEGNGAKLVFSDPRLGMFHLYGTENVTIRNLTLDYDPVPFTQGTITSISQADRTVTIELDGGYPALDHEMFDSAPFVWASVHTSDGDFVSNLRREGRLDKHFSSIESIGGRRYELALTESSSLTGLEESRKLAVVARGFATGIVVSNVDQPLIENVTIRASPAFAMFVEFSTDPIVRNCAIAPPPDSNRLISSDADGIYCASCYSGPTIENCELEQLEDDGIIVSTPATWVTALVDERTIRVKNVTGVTAEAGDILEAKSASGSLIGELPPVSDVEYYVRNETIPGKPRMIRFEQPVDDLLEEGDYLVNSETGNRGFQIRNNTVRNNRASLLRLSGGSGIVEDNEFDGSSNPAIEIESNSSRQYEAKGWVRDVTIRGNRIRRSGLNYFAHNFASAIHLVNKRLQSDSAGGRPHRNVEIVDNTILDSAYLGMNLNDAKGVRVQDNTIEEPNQLDYSHYFGTDGYGLGVRNVSDVELTNNRVAGSASELYQFGWRQNSENVSHGENQLEIDGQSQSASIVTPSLVEMEFNKTVQPSDVNPESDDDRPLAFWCHRLTLLDDAGNAIVDVNVGGAENSIAFGDGVYPAGTSEKRWFGSSDAISGIYFLDHDLNDAVQLRMTGSPIDDGMSAVLRVMGRTVDEVSFGSNDEVADYTFDL